MSLMLTSLVSSSLSPFRSHSLRYFFKIKLQSKMLKCAGNDDIITMKADDTGDVVTFMFESPGESPPLSPTHPISEPTPPDISL